MAEQKAKIRTEARANLAAVIDNVIAPMVKERMQKGDRQESFSLVRLTERVMVRELIKGDGATSTVRLLYYAITSYMKPDGSTCWPSEELLARDIGVKSVKTVQRGLRVLEAKGAIETKPMPHEGITQNGYTSLPRAYANEIHEAWLAREKAHEIQS